MNTIHTRIRPPWRSLVFVSQNAYRKNTISFLEKFCCTVELEGRLPNTNWWYSRQSHKSLSCSLSLSLSLAYHPSLPPPHCFCTTVFFLSSPLRPISSQALERNPLPFDQQLSRHARHSVVFLSFFNLLRSANAHMLQQRGGRCASSQCIFFL